MSSEPGVEVALAGGQLRLELTPAARKLRLDLLVALEELRMDLGITAEARLLGGLALLQRLLQLRDAGLRSGRGSFRSCYLIGKRAGALFRDIAFGNSKLECLLAFEQPLAFACQALFDLTQRARQCLQVDLEAGTIFVDDGVGRYGRGRLP